MTKRLILRCDDMLSRFAFKFNVRRFTEAYSGGEYAHKFYSG